jgi:hypothetical protein
VPDNAVDIVKSIVRVIHPIVLGNLGFASNDDFSLDAGEGIGDNGGRRRLLVFAGDGCEGFVLFVYSSIEAFGPSEIFGHVSPDI